MPVWGPPAPHINKALSKLQPVLVLPKHTNGVSLSRQLDAAVLQLLQTLLQVSLLPHQLCETQLHTQGGVSPLGCSPTDSTPAKGNTPVTLSEPGEQMLLLYNQAVSKLFRVEHLFTEHLLLIPLQCACLTLDPSLAEQCNRAETT